MSDDPINDPLAAMDQLLAGMKDMAKIVRAFHVETVEAGFDPAEAIHLTSVFAIRLIFGEAES